MRTNNKQHSFLADLDAKFCSPTVQTDRSFLAQRSVEVFGKNPFDWQLDACVSILCGQDVILDVGTGNGKTLVFGLRLLTDPKDVNIIVSPLSALMTYQVNFLPVMYILVLISNKARSSTLPLRTRAIDESGCLGRVFIIFGALSGCNRH